MSVPFHKPFISGNELNNLAIALKTGELSGGQNKGFVQQVQDWLENYCQVAKALFTTSCTDALEMAALLTDIQPGDEVILPSYTFVSTANAFVLRGARPVFVDSRPDTLNLDEEQLESKITDRTKAVVVVHYGGVACEMDRIKAITDNHGLWLIEDNAQGLGGFYRGKPLGSIGHLSTLSFHETKNATAGEGGALLINEPTLIERAECLLEKGTNRTAFLKGHVDKYTWVDVGSSFLGSNLSAAILMAQLDVWQDIQDKREKLWKLYYDSLKVWASGHQVVLPETTRDITPAYHLFYCLFLSKEQRREVEQSLNNSGIKTAGHFIPLHLSPMGRGFGYKKGDCPVAESISDRMLRLPLYPSLKSAQVEKVVTNLIQA